jgi:hypothetical protein
LSYSQYWASTKARGVGEQREREIYLGESQIK